VSEMLAPLSSGGNEKNHENLVTVSSPQPGSKANIKVKSSVL
jgi:hypothetical protein